MSVPAVRIGGRTLINQSTFRRIVTGIFVGLCAVLAGPSAFAEIDEVVVTATKREATVQSTGAAVSAFTGDELGFRDLETVEDLAHSVPGLVYGEMVGNPQITIRGVGLSVETGLAEMGVATYVNGVFLSRPGLTNLALGDLARAEVLRGPQGTLYGRNATGGAVNFITRLPTNEWEFSGSASIASHGERKGDIAVSGPVVRDRLMFRLYAKYDEMDGYLENLSAGAGNDTIYGYDSLSLRATALVKPFDNFSLSFQAGHLDKEGTYNAYQMLRFAGIPIPTSPTFVTTEPNKAYHNFDDDVSHQATFFSATAEWDIGPITVKSITGYTVYDNVSWYDGDTRNPPDLLVPLPLPLPIPLLENGLPVVDIDMEALNTRDYTTFTEEINVSGKLFDRVDFIVGAFYMRETGNSLNAAYFGAQSAAPGMALVESTIAERNVSMAVFADINIRLIDQVRLVLGGRLGRDTKDGTQFDASAVAALLNGYNLDGTCDANKKLTFEGFSPKAGLEYDLFDDTLIYATYQKATKPGGTNITICGDTFGEEELVSYEAGIKTKLLGGRLIVNAVGFYYDYENYQVFNLMAPATADITNAPKSHVAGAELEIFAEIGEYVSVNGGFSYMNAVYDEFVAEDPLYTLSAANLGPGPQDLSGNKLTRAPEISFNVGVETNIPINRFWIGALIARFDLSYTGETFYRQFNTDFDKWDGYFLANLTVAVTSQDGVFQLRGYVKNLTDEEYVVNQLAQTLASTAFLPDAQGRQGSFLGMYGRPRTFGLTLSALF